MSTISVIARAGFEVLEQIGAGSMGEVWRVRDPELNRVMALKVLQAAWMKDLAVVQRFVAEAQATAQLEHPGIVPVHALSYLSDGRPFFTMKEVRGRTLSDVIRQAHAEAGELSLRRLIDLLHRVCEAVAYAHARGVIHRDLKPSNVMIGDFGEVLVVDWGLVKIGGRPEQHVAESTEARPDALAPVPGSDETGSSWIDAGSGSATRHASPDPIVTVRSADAAQATRLGTVSGTPAYMPPEQARGQLLGPTADVYALGAILYEILTGGPPYTAPSAIGVLAQVASRPPPPPHERTSRSIPTDLEDICLRAMARAPDARYPHAQALARAIEAWLDGARRRERALTLVARARELGLEVDDLREEARAARSEAQRLLAAIPALTPPTGKEPAWELEDAALERLRQAEIAEVSLVQTLGVALAEMPGLPEAHEALADLYQQRHAEAERGREPAAASRYEALLRSHDRGRHAAWLRGEGRITLITRPEGAEVELFRYVSRSRRLIPESRGLLGTTPLIETAVPVGSYLLEVRAPGRAVVRVPVTVGRLEHWDGVSPEGSGPYELELPPAEGLPPGECYVPAGWFVAGGDAQAVRGGPRQRLWMDGFVMQRFPVTHAEYIEFLNDLSRTGREEELLRAAPRLRLSVLADDVWVYRRDADGMFSIQVDAEGDSFPPDGPVVTPTWTGACLYAKWLAERSGLPWRLPLELEREKAGRGVDERIFPWGDHLDPTFCCSRDSHRGRPLPQPIDVFPIDESPYGVRGLAGNVRDWCSDIWSLNGPPVSGSRAVASPYDEDMFTAHSIRGGSWSGGALIARLCSRAGEESIRTSYNCGFRLVRSYG